MISAAMPKNITTQQHRLEFIVGLCKEIFKQSSCTINMDAYNLYSADGHAVKELLKLAMVLLQARQIALEDDDDNENFDGKLERGRDCPTEADVKEATLLATEIIDLGAQLEELLLAEVENRPTRGVALKFLDAMSSNLELCTREHDHVETSILRVVQTTKEDSGALTNKFSDLVAEEKRLQVAIKKRERDIERNQQRLEGLKTMRPSFLDEYEQLEKEYQKQYDIFVERYRNVDYLEHEAAAVRANAEKNTAANQTLQRVQKQYQDDELRLLSGQEDLQNQKDGLMLQSESTER